MIVSRAIEYFHLLFLRHLGERLDKRLFSLKGGCNLRFFFKSIRYSEDIDLDVQQVSKATLQRNVRKILSSQSFSAALVSRGLSVTSISEPKQTETTQRWKIAISSEEGELVIPTKIEFSRRGMKARVVVENVDPEIIASQRMFPIIIPHYALEAALKQKIEALVGRNDTQSRDVFDIHLLLAANGGELPFELAPSVIEEAIDRIRALSFSDFQGQVVAYLDPAYRELYYSRGSWDRLTGEVIAYISRMTR